MRIKFLVLSLFILLLNCSEVKRNNSTHGILYPHLNDSNFVYLDKVYNNYVYSANDFQELADEIINFSTIVVSEDFGYLIKNPQSMKYAIQGFNEVDTTNINFNIEADSNFYSEIWKNTVLKKWSTRYETKYLKDGNKLYPVSTTYSDDITYIFYVVSEFEIYNGNEYLLFAMQKEERYSVYLDKKNNSYSASKCNYFWVPIEEGEKREIKENDIATALMKYFKL